MRNAFLSDKSASSRSVKICVLILVIATIVGTIIIGDILFKPDDISPPDSLETDDSTSTPPEPTTPDTVPPENATATEPPEPEPPTPTVLQINLDEALERNLVKATISGDGLQYVDVTLESIAEELLDNLLQVAIPVGTVFAAQSSGLQDMVVIESTVFELEPVGDILSDLVSVACKSMMDDAPSGDDELVVSSEPISVDLGLLLGLSDFQDETFRVQQFAIWTITDNPTRYGYVNLGTFMYGSGPSDEEMSRIQDLFNSAGISTSDYYALN